VVLRDRRPSALRRRGGRQHLRHRRKPDLVPTVTTAFRKEDPLEGCPAGAAPLAVWWASLLRRWEGDPDSSGASSESWSSRQSPRKHRAPAVDSSAASATDFPAEKALRSGEAEVFGRKRSNDEREGALETGKTTAGEGKASKGAAPVRRVGRTGGPSCIGFGRSVANPAAPHLRMHRGSCRAKLLRKPRDAARLSTVGSKPGGPHGRQQGATNLQGRMRSKPSES
jgi:hypothetical protein